MNVYGIILESAKQKFIQKPCIMVCFQKRQNEFAKDTHSVKIVHIRGFFWSVFSYIQSEYRKIQPRKNSVFGHFSCSDDEFKSVNTVQTFYRDSELTTKKVLALFKADPKINSERERFKYLRRHIRGLDKVFLLKLFVTGAVIVSNILDILY